jgi:hypothetical protein
MSAQNAEGESFMDVYAAALEKKLGRKVRLTLLTSNNATTVTVRQGLASGGKYREEVAGADVIVISVGGGTRVRATPRDRGGPRARTCDGVSGMRRRSSNSADVFASIASVTLSPAG